MEKVLVLLLFTLLQAGWIQGQKGFVGGKLGEELDDLMTSFSKEGYSGAVLIEQNGEVICVKIKFSPSESKKRCLPLMLMLMKAMAGTL